MAAISERKRDGTDGPINKPNALIAPTDLGILTIGEMRVTTQRLAIKVKLVGSVSSRNSNRQTIARNAQAECAARV